MKKIILSLLLCAALLLPCLTGCVGVKSDDKDVIRLCEVTHSVFYAPQYAAMANGFFEKRGIEIELTNGGGADKVMSAVLSGSADIGLAGAEACLYVSESGRENPPAVFAALTACDGSFLVAREPDPDFSWEKLKGSHILPGRKGGMPFMAFRFALEKNGIDPDSELYLDNTIQFDMMAGAFLGGTGDYVTMFEPAASALEAEGKGYIVAGIGEAAGPMPYTVYFAEKDRIGRDEKLIRAFTEAIAEGQKWVAEHTPEEIAETVSPYFPDSDGKLLASAIANYQRIGAYAASPVMTKEDFDRMQEVVIAAGELENPVEFDQIIDNTFASDAEKKLR